ncbi:hypothetical protein LTR51_006174 [Lithohypha guttulata]|uniref:Uncharacterized protein n=2 Tax=Lithohypha guttulata TaxID=1690604 RepID=A0AAN7Y7U4_9EURO|nr:hypothetical protein LTR51_006174 [Lithohypha guttulata]KAK5088378.1 hypothetical protein LTR05_002596 [Lithohypha guttulata]
MTVTPMRPLSTISTAALSPWKRLLRIFGSRPDQNLSLLPIRTLAQVRSESLSELWFTAAVPAGSTPRTQAQQELGAGPFVRLDGINGGRSPGGDQKPPDERTMKLGKTLRTLSPLLPNILTTQLPPEIVSPYVTLHLFPSTHPHLPVVKGKIPYRAALWTAPVAWGCVPVVGNVKLEILSEKMVRSGYITAPSHVEAHCGGLREEKLVVRWRTEPRRHGNGKGHAVQSATSESSAVDNGGINRGLSTLLGGDRPLFGGDAGSNTFTGLFVFSFDSEGRIANHTIEHADEAGGFDKTSKVVTLADWLLGKARWRGLREEDALPVPGLAYRMKVCRDEIRKQDRWGRRH